MAEKGSYQYLDEERKLIWTELRKAQSQLSDTIKITSLLKDNISELERTLPEDARSAKANYSTIIKYKNQISTAKDEINSILSKATEAINHINDLANSAASANEEILKAKDVSLNTAEQIQKSIDIIDIVDEHYSDHENIIAQIEKLDELSLSIASIKEKTNQTLISAQKNHKEIKDLHNAIFGYTYKDEETEEIEVVTGLKHALEESYEGLKTNISSTSKQVDDLTKNSKTLVELAINENNLKISEKIEQWQVEHDEILKTIRSLLPAALTAGLSVAFSDKKDAELKEQQLLTSKFSDTIKFLSAISLCPVLVSFYFIYQSGIEKAINMLPQLTTAAIPIYIPILWLAYSYNKRLNLSKRLVEEYTHKEVLSKTFEGLSSQIDKIDNSEVSKELRIKLLYNLLNVSSENPGKLISDYNKSDHPVLDVLEKSSKLSDAVESLSKIPGMGAIGKFIDSKADAILATESKKVEAGLSKVQRPRNQVDISAPDA